MQITEQPSLYDHLEKKSVREILEDINREDQKVASAVQKAIPQIEHLVNLIVPRMRQGGRIFYMGAGTSGRLGVLDASEVPPTFGMSPNWIIGLIAGGDTALRNPVEGAEDDTNRGWEELTEHHINNKDTVIGIAASGTTPYVIGALHEARKQGILTGCITSNPDSPMAAEADVAIEMIVGPEYVTGSSRVEIGTRAKNDSKHDQHFCDDPTRTGERKQNGEHAIEQSKVSGKRNTDDYGGIRIRPRSCPKVIIASWFGKESN